MQRVDFSGFTTSTATTNPKTGNFTQQDSLDAPLNPLDANRYAYAGNNAINLIHATGQKACLRSTLAGAAGGAVTGRLSGAFTGLGAAGGVGAGAAIGGIGRAATCGAPVSSSESWE